MSAVILLLVVVGCGSSGSSSNTTASGGTATVSDATAAARVKAANCMRGQGINIPDLTPGRGQILSVLRILGSYPPNKVQAAMHACAASIRQAFPNATNITPAQRAQRTREAQVFAQCMRARGISFPDPTNAAGNPAAYLRALGSVDSNSPAYKGAEPACRQQALKVAGG